MKSATEDDDPEKVQVLNLVLPYSRRHASIACLGFIGKEGDTMNLIHQNEVGNPFSFHSTFKLYLQVFQTQAKTEHYRKC